MAETWSELRGRNHRLLTFAEAQEIRRLYAAGRYTERALGEVYGVARTTIGNIVQGSTYREEKPPITDADWPLRGALAIGQGRRCCYPFEACTCSGAPVFAGAVKGDHLSER